MATTYEVYKGGARQQNSTFAMLPAAPFDATVAAPFKPAVKQAPIAVGLDQTYAFGQPPVGGTGDTALYNFLQTITLASGDKFGAIIIPENMLAVGIFWSVNTALAGGAFSLATRIGTTALLASHSTATVDSDYVPWPTAPAYFKTPDIIDVTWDTVPGSGMGNLNLSLMVYLVRFVAGAN